MYEIHPYIDKIINAPPNTYVIFFVHNCGYSKKALELLRKNKVAYKGYDIDNLNGEMPQLLEVLNTYSQLIDFNPNHRTKPIIFINGKYLGGYDQLTQYLK